MAVKSDLVVREVDGYPRLMMSSLSGVVVLFWTAGKGTVVNSGNGAESTDVVGDYSQIWNMDVFVDFKGTVTLSN